MCTLEEGGTSLQTIAGARELPRRKKQQERQHGIGGYANSNTEFRGGGYGNSKNGCGCEGFVEEEDTTTATWNSREGGYANNNKVRQ